jgi:hypothetical protein
MREYRVCLIACSGTKLDEAAPARDLYQGDLFRKSLLWSQTRERFDSTFVLSAKHGLLALDKVIEPYNLTLNNMAAADRRAWACGVASDLVAHLASVQADRIRVVALAGRLYVEGLIELLRGTRNVEVERPLMGLGIGQQKAWLKRAFDAM